MLWYFGFDPWIQTAWKNRVIETIKTTVEYLRVTDNGKTISEIKNIQNRLEKIDIQSYCKGLKENKNIGMGRFYWPIRVD